ncbi:AIPR family protein [Mesorhizobium sp. WSM2561]|uniref:AIPR family protein n=1 Tax=Mesorhizobium sp. WSM2561 TaxID=1040985 RepID=UPI0004B9C9B9|nr:AIPR family protein [Mesorhizobium sp. WSM2561]
MEDFNRQIRSEILGHASDSGITAADTFFEYMAARLEAAGEIETADRASFEGTASNKSIRIDGSGGDPRDAEGVLSAIICDFHEDDVPVTINAADTKRLFGYLVNFLVFSRKVDFRASLPVGSSGAGLADLIANSWKSVMKIKLILMTNAIYSARTDAVAAGTIGEIPVTYNVWDLSRFFRYESSGQAREDLVIEFKDSYGASVPALAASRLGEELESYLMVIPGSQLADIYDKWGARLLEANVRSFLQARGKVNQGIRDTIKSYPEMFFSYNNGLSATADSVETVVTSNGLGLVSARNLQIVNGGQTTASIHAARRISPESLANVHVQMKLTVVPPERSDEVVPKISEYANSQNKVSAADFFSNHPFHVRMEEYSRRILAPAVEMTRRETKWFYERARGQYLVERARRSDAERRRFETEFPKAQLFAKTDLAKVEFSFRGKPESVSRGAQKNFAEFAKEIGVSWSKSDTQFDETWYRRLISKLILFRYVEKLVPKQEWYPGGYRANIVTYSIAKLVADTNEMNQLVDLDAIWKAQAVSEELGKALLKSAEVAAEVITHPPAGIRNITEWAKKQACWENLKRRKIEYSSSVMQYLVEPQDAMETVRDTRRDAAMVSGIEAQTKVISAGAIFWNRVRLWGTANRKFNPKEDGILKACEGMSGRLPSEKQCIAALEILESAQAAGYEDDNEAPRVKLTGWQRQH